MKNYPAYYPYPNKEYPVGCIEFLIDKYNLWNIHDDDILREKLEKIFDNTEHKYYVDYIIEMKDLKPIQNEEEIEKTVSNIFLLNKEKILKNLSKNTEKQTINNIIGQVLKENDKYNVQIVTKIIKKLLEKHQSGY